MRMGGATAKFNSKSTERELGGTGLTSSLMPLVTTLTYNDRDLSVILRILP
jgi:hypothetical protein